MNDIIRPDGQPSKPVLATIFEVAIPLPTDDVEKLKSGCLVPVYQPGVAVLGEHSGMIRTADGKTGQVMVGHAGGFTGGEALIVRETAAALDQIRGQMTEFQTGLRVALHGLQELAGYARRGEGGQVSAEIRALEQGIQDVRDAFFPDEPEEPS